MALSKDNDGALEPTIYPVLTAWGFTTEENRIPSDTEIAELLKNVGYERIRLKDTTVQLDSGMMLDLGSVGKGYAGDLAAQVLKDNGITSALRCAFYFPVCDGNGACHRVLAAASEL